MLTTRIQTIISHNNLVSPGEKWVIAVSGGLDSLALLYMLYTLKARLSLSLHVATYDHGLRGDAGAADVRFVMETAKSLGLPASSGRGDVRTQAAQSGEGIEAAARRARYDFLAGVARETGAAAVVTAHHADDQAETVLMHILRGSGLDGLRGMALKGTVPGHADVPLIRPLLAIPRAELATYCDEHGLHPREDASNADTRYLRNRIRHQTMPALRAINPQITAALIRLAENAATDSDYMDAQTQHVADRLLTLSDERVTLDRQAFSRLHPALQRRLIRHIVAHLSDESPAQEHIHNAVRIGSSGEQGAVVQFPGGVQLRVDYASLVIESVSTPRPAPPRTPLLQAGQVVAVGYPGETVIPGAGWSLEIRTTNEGDEAVASLYILPDATMYLRTRRPGERFRPCGMNGHTRSIKKWMIDRKIPQYLRDRIPILDIHNEIAAILTGNQWQIDEKFAKSGKKLIKIYLFVDYS